MRKRLVALGVGLVLVAAACGNSPSGESGSGGGSGGAPGTTVANADLTKNVPSTQPGVTDTEIHVGGVTSKTNPLQAEYDQAFNGVKAYFEMVNSQGGIYGRKLVLSSERDDQTAKNQDQAQALVSQDNVFAVLPVATLLFTGADTFADAKMPTFGWNINTEWGGKPTLFGEKGSYLCTDCAYPTLPWLAKKIGAKKVGVLGYNVPQSAECADGVKKSFEKWPSAEIAYADTAVPFGSTDLSQQVSKMKQAGVDFVTTCVDTNGSITLAQELNRQNLKIAQYLPNGYDQELLAKYADVMEGSYVGTQFVPFEAAQPPAGLQDYFTWIDKVPGGKRNELSLAGWMDADLLYQGLKGAGPEFTQASVVDAINSMRNWTANGINTGVDWTIAHDKDDGDSCFAMVKVEKGKFVPQFSEPGKYIVCMPNDTSELPDQPTLRGPEGNGRG